MCEDRDQGACIRYGLLERVRISCGDVRGINSLLTNSERDAVGALHGRSILNQFFRDGPAEVIEFLRTLGRFFPGRLFFAVDYYSLLSRLGGTNDNYDALLQDIAQILSGQGSSAAGSRRLDSHL